MDEGIWIEYKPKKLVITRVDGWYAAAELQALRNNATRLYYVSKGIVALFLLWIDDSLETSDLPFCIHEQLGEPGIDEFLQSEAPLDVTIRYLTTDQQLAGQREGHCSALFSRLVKEDLRRMVSTPYDPQAVDQALARLQQRYQPYAMEPMALAVTAL